MVARSLARPALVAPTLCLLYSLGLVILTGDPFVLVTLGERFAPLELQGHAYSPTGYDGQFTYYLARYGLDSEPHLDVPAYRAQRILLPVAAHLMARGDPGQLIWVLLLLNVGGLAMGTYSLERLLRRRTASPWFALAVALSLGMFGSVRMTTTEPLAFGLALAGLDFADRRAWWSAGVAFALAALARETTLLFPAACALALIARDGWRPLGPIARVLLPACTASFAWQLVLYDRYGALGAGSGGAQTTGFELVPLWGYAGPIVQLVRTGNWANAGVLAILMGAFVVVPVLWSLRWLLKARPFSQWNLACWVLMAHAVVILFIPASTFTEPLGMFRFITGFEIALVLFAADRGLTEVLKYSLLWCGTLFVLLVPDLHTVLP